jgi:hypothetical protein
LRIESTRAMTSTNQTRRSRCLALVVVALGGAALAVVPAALASTFTKSGGTLVYTAAPGETNNVNIFREPDGSGYSLSDGGLATFDPSLGCDAFGGCPGLVVSAISADLGDGDDQYTGVSDVPQTVLGGDGNDTITTAGATSRIEGGPGNDLLHGGGPPLSGQRTYFVGGPGDDEITTGLDGDTIDCTGGGNDAANRFLSPVHFIGCGDPPAVTVQIKRVRLRSWLKHGLPFTVTCSQPCGLDWQLMPAKRRDFGVIHTHSCGCFFFHNFRQTDEKQGAFERLNVTSGPQKFIAGIHGTATKKAVGKRRSFKLRLQIKADNELTVERVVNRAFTLKR